MGFVRLLIATSVALGLMAAGRRWGDEREELQAAFRSGQALEQRADYPAAAAQYERASALAPGVFGADTVETAVILHNLADVYTRMSQYAKAESSYQRVVKIREARQGANHLDVALTLNNLAVVYNETGQVTKAEQLFQRVLKIYEAAPTRDDLRIAGVMNNLALHRLENGPICRGRAPLSAESSDPRSKARTRPSSGGHEPQ